LQLTLQSCTGCGLERHGSKTQKEQQRRGVEVSRPCVLQRMGYKTRLVGAAIMVGLVHGCSGGPYAGLVIIGLPVVRALMNRVF
jgi:hypothetical protein